MTSMGVGIDIVDVARMRDACAQDSFLERTFTDIERTYCDSFKDKDERYAGTFAAKEAVRKATGELSRSFREVEVRRDELGKPGVWNEGVRRDDIEISISHSAGVAVAVAIRTS